MPAPRPCLAAALALPSILISAAAAQSSPARLQEPAAPPPVITIDAPDQTLTFPADRNAALVYLRHIELIDDDFKNAAATALADADAPIPDALAQRLADFTDSADAIERASRLDTCDFAIERELGPYALLPHLGRLRALARVLAADARRLEETAQPEPAARRIATIVRMSEHLAHDRVVISSLVGLACQRLALAEIERALDRGRLDDPARAILREALREIDPANPVGLREALAGDAEWLLDYIDAQLDAGHTDSVNAVLRDLGLDDVQGLDDAQLRRYLDDARRFNHRAVDAWNDPDASAKLAALEQLVAAGAFGPVAKGASASIARVHANATDTADALRRVLDRLEAP